ncbi:MAG: hypothetical protein CSB16_02150 [Clostridiales bacterium]|nr:MAG: hypothetical protein CSB16_02150 [Clostridiales bacterium]
MKKIIVILALALTLIFVSSCSSKEVEVETGDTSVKVDGEKGEVSVNTSEGSVEIDKTKVEVNDEEDDKDSSEDSSNEDKSSFQVPGYQLGEIPAIPIVEVPTIPSYSEDQENVLEAIEEKIKDIPGVSVKPATCENGKIAYVSDFLVTDGDSSVTNTDEGSSVVNTDGSGVLSSGDTTAVVSGDGSGVLNKDGVTAVVDADGNGTITDTNKGIVITRDADGSGTYIDEKESIVVANEREGTYEGPNYSLIYSKDEAQFTSEELQIIISNGKAMITKGDESITVDAKPLAKVPLIGKLPTLEKLKRSNICGIRIVFDDSVLFDFDKFDLRPEGKEVIKNVVKTVNELNINSIEVHGHTDSIGTDEYNQELSENRAKTVKDYAIELNIKSNVVAQGFGESMPVAPNENSDGSDNPSGRQANRRVEFFIPIE